MNQQEPLKIGLCGVGTMGQCAHLKHYATLNDCQVVALAEPRAKTAELVAKRYNVPTIYADFREMLSAQALDAVVAAQPFSRHGLMVPELLAADLPVFIEKPLAGTIAAGERIAKANQQSKGWLMVGYHKRSDPATMWAVEQIANHKNSGELGRLNYVRVTMPPGDWVVGGFDDLIDGGDPSPALETDPPSDDMDAETFEAYTGFVNYYIHQVNLVRHLLGEKWQVTHAEPSGLLLVGSSESGIPCTIEMSPYATTRGWEESALVAFERGYLKLDLPAPLAAGLCGHVELYEDPGNGHAPRRITPRLPAVSAMRQQAKNFLAAVRGERPPTCTADEALEDIRVAREYIRLWKNQ